MKSIFNLVFAIFFGIVLVVVIGRYLLKVPLLSSSGDNLALLVLWGFVFWGLVNILPLPSIGGMP